MDALKKLENEKVKKNSSSGMVNISGELLREDHRRPPGGGIWKVVAVVLAASLLTFGVTYFFLMKGKQGGVENHSLPLVEPVKTMVPRVTLSVPVPQRPASAPVQTPLAVAVKPVSPAVAIPAASVDKIAGPSAVVRNRQKPQPTHNRPLQLASQQEVPIAAVSQPRTDIKVSGIAWQDERSARRAVVNGFLMREQGVVAGAKISEIMQDRVRFTQAGTTFEIPLVASGQPVARK